MQYHFARRHWRLLTAMALVGLAATPLAFLLPATPRWFMLGVWLTAIVAFGHHIVVVMSGSAYLIPAESAEQWTRQELHRFRRRGWQIVHHVLLREAGDIDHVAIGDAGVIVMETKWSSRDWKSRAQQKFVFEAVRQARTNARTVALFLRSVVGDVPVYPVVVLWPSDPEFHDRRVDEVTVLAGLSLREWIEGLPANRLDADAASSAWQRLEKQLARRDEKDLERFGPPPKTVTGYVVTTLAGPFGLFVGLLFGSLMLSWIGWPASLLPSIFFATVFALLLKVPSIHLLAAGAFVGVGVVVGVMVVAQLLTVLT